MIHLYDSVHFEGAICLFQCRLVWSPGLIKGNEMTASLSRQASATKYTGTEPVLGIASLTVRNELQHWACREQWNQWHEAMKCRKAKQLLRQADVSLNKYALWLYPKQI